MPTLSFKLSSSFSISSVRALLAKISFSSLTRLKIGGGGGGGWTCGGGGGGTLKVDWGGGGGRACAGGRGHMCWVIVQPVGEEEVSFVSLEVCLRMKRNIAIQDGNKPPGATNVKEQRRGNESYTPGLTVLSQSDGRIIFPSGPIRS